MRVLMFGWEFPPHISGGLGTACFELTAALTRQGTEIVFVLPRVGDPSHPVHVKLRSAARVPLPRGSRRTAAFLQRLRVRAVASLLRPYLRDTDYARLRGRQEIRRLGRAVRRTGILDADSPYGSNLLAEVVRYSEVAEVIARQETFDVIHAHDWMTFLAGLRAREASGKPLLLHVHALEYDRGGARPNAAVVHLEQAALRLADRVVAVSDYTRAMLVRRYGIPAEKITVVHNAVSRRQAERVYRVRRARAGKVVLFLGRVTLQKGPDYFVEAAARVLEQVPDATFVMAGAGDMLPRLIERVGQLRIGRQFHFTGFLQGPEVERMFALSDVYVMPSVSEPFGIAPLEAAAYDVPVIVSRHAGVAEVLTHALKVDFWNVRDLANKIIAVLKYPALARELRTHARRELRRIRWSAAADKVQAVYRQLTA